VLYPNRGLYPNYFFGDEDSREMLDIIFYNIVFDSGMNYFGFEENMQKLF